LEIKMKGLNLIELMIVGYLLGILAFFPLIGVGLGLKLGAKLWKD